MDWKKVEAFAEEIGEKLLGQASVIVTDVEKDHSDAPHETKTDLAATALVQASDVGKNMDPNETAAINALTAVAGAFIKALKTAPPAPPAAAAPAPAPTI